MNPETVHSQGDWLPFTEGQTQTLGNGSASFVDAFTQTLAVIPPTDLPNYEILRELGRGGMGVVYLARHRQLGRLVALKMLLAGFHSGSTEFARFQAEAQAIAQLQHRHIVQIYEIGQHQGLPFLALEYVDGGSLAQLINGRPQAPREAARLVRFLAEAIAFAHDRGIIHRDLKPANILLSAEAQKAGDPPSQALNRAVTMSSHKFPKPATFYPKITDFGLAKRQEGSSTQTKTGEVVGTPSYMAPEQATGKLREFSPAVDIYALGAILYELLTGRPPFQGLTPMDTVLQVMSTEPVRPRRLVPGIPRDLETICLKCLQKEPAKRYPTAKALADDLNKFLEGHPIAARPVGPVERTVRWCRRNPTLAWLTVATVVLALATIGSGFVVLWQYTRQEQAALRREFLEAQAAQAAERNAQAAMTEVRFWQTQAEASNQWAHWTKALEAAKRAQAEYARLPARKDEQQQLAELSQKLEKREAAAAQAEKDARMLHRLDEIAARRSDYGRERNKVSESNQKYAEAFREYGIDVERLPLPEAARLLKASNITGRLREALDDWALIRYEEANASPERWRPLTELASADDGVTFRVELRRAMAQRDPEAYVRLSQEAGAHYLGDRALFLLARLLWIHHRNAEAIRFTEEAIVRDPNEVHYYFLINRILREMRPVPWEKLLRYQTATLALRPQAVIHRNLANTLENLGLAEQALEHRLVAVQRNQDPLQVQYELANAYRHRRRYAEAAQVYREVTKKEADFRQARARLAEVLLYQGQFAAAITEAKAGQSVAEQRQLCEQIQRRAEALQKVAAELPKRAANDGHLAGEELADAALVLKYSGKPEAAWATFEELRAQHPSRWAKLGNGTQQEAINAAVLASRETGDASQQAYLRGTALKRLQARLAEVRQRLTIPAAYDESREVLIRWCGDVELSAVRDPAAMAVLPEGERKEWTAFWNEVRTLLRTE